MAAHQAPLSLRFSRQEHWSELPLPSPMHESEKWKWSHSVMSDPSRRHGLQPTTLLHPWDSPRILKPKQYVTKPEIKDLFHVHKLSILCRISIKILDISLKILKRKVCILSRFPSTLWVSHTQSRECDLLIWAQLLIYDGAVMFRIFGNSHLELSSECWNSLFIICSVQFSSVSQSCLSLWHAMDCSTLDHSVHHQLLELTQTHVHSVGDAIQLSHPLLSPSPPAFNLSQHQGLFQWVSFSHHMAKVLEFELQH